MVRLLVSSSWRLDSTSNWVTNFFFTIFIFYSDLLMVSETSFPFMTDKHKHIYLEASLAWHAGGRGHESPCDLCPRGERTALTAAVLPQAPPSARLISRWRFRHSGNVDYLFHQILQFQIQIQEPKVTIKSKMSLSGHPLQSVLHITLLTCPHTHKDERFWYGNAALNEWVEQKTENCQPRQC